MHPSPASSSRIGILADSEGFGASRKSLGAGIQYLRFFLPLLMDPKSHKADQEQYSLLITDTTFVGTIRCLPANCQSRITLWDLRISNQDLVSFILRILRLSSLPSPKKKKPIFINLYALFIKIFPKTNVFTLQTPGNYSFLSSFLPLLLKPSLSLCLSLLLMFSLSLWISLSPSLPPSFLPSLPQTFLLI